MWCAELWKKVFHEETIENAPESKNTFYIWIQILMSVRLLQTHIGQKDFACDLCDKCYYTPVSLFKNKFNSAKSNLYWMPFQKDLKKHIRIIHEKLRFFCQVSGCSGNFAQRDYYKKHVISQHQNLGIEFLEELLESIKLQLPQSS